MEDRDSLDSRDDCPDRERVLSVVEGANVPPVEAGAILYHLLTCDECRQAVSFVCAANAAEKRRTNRPATSYWNRIISTIDVWSARSPEGVPDADDMALAAAAPKRVLVFTSEPRSNGASVWRAEVKLPAPDDPVGVLRIVVQDGNGSLLCGKFRLCGVECEVGNGKPATISIQEFRANHSQGGVSFAEAGKPFSAGVPVLSSIL